MIQRTALSAYFKERWLSGLLEIIANHRTLSSHYSISVGVFPFLEKGKIIVQKKYSKRIAAAASSLACVAAAPAASDAGVITVTGSPVSLAVSAANGTSVTWDIDGDSIGEFRLHMATSSIFLASDTSGGGQGNGRGLVGPSFFTDNVQALVSSFNVGPTVAPFVWGNGSGFYAYRNAMSSGGAIGYDFNYGFVSGDNFVGFRFDDGIGAGLNYGFAVFNFDTTNGIVTIDRWAYETIDDLGVHVSGSAFTAVPEPGSLSLLACGAVGLMAYRRRRLAVKSAEETPTEFPA